MTAAQDAEARIAALAPFTVAGPRYERGVVEFIAAARRSIAKGETDGAGRWLAQAEQCAGLITMDQMVAILYD